MEIGCSSRGFGTNQKIKPPYAKASEDRMVNQWAAGAVGQWKISRPMMFKLLFFNYQTA